ncbi:SH3 domain-containing protein [Salipiger sp.]|uniref:SH3 domain-containing protein n=1 Tax=Salipiger sp. TaxID=2078585 RepID=UPI003A97FB84
MTRLILLTFGVLGWAWYEMSGGADFGSGSGTVVAEAEASDVTAPEVARAASGASSAVVPRPAPRLSAEPAATVDLALARARPAEAPLTAPVTAIAAVAEAPVMTDAPRDETALADAIPESEPVAEAAAATEAPDMLSVTGSRVNLRNGPGTRYSVVGQLVRGDEVERLTDNGAGWIKLRSVRGGRIGWMADDFLEVASN